MSLEPKPNCNHCHCSKGWFTDTEPLHTHDDPLCHNCHRQPPPGSQLSRCTGCYICTYCSQECREEAWSKGHQAACRPHSIRRERAAELSGNPDAWADLMDWVDFHHDSFVNATLHAYLTELPDKSFPAASADSLVMMAVWYRNDPTLPVGKKFELRGTQYFEKADPNLASIRASISRTYDRAVKLGKSKLGNAYKGTGTYMLEIRFGPHDRIPHDRGMVCIPFTKHFTIDDKHAVALEACRDPFQQLKENVDEGKKIRFCCGQLPGRSTCCCGGWTHEQPESADVINHLHCKLGLFHSSSQLHTHPHCSTCFRMRRCEGNNMKLLRCGGCSLATYCSKTCQKEHWHKGHKTACQLLHSKFRDTAIASSGNPQAWLHLVYWAEFHHTSLINATIARYLQKKDNVSGDVTANYLLHLSLNYRNDPTLPPEKQFEFVQGQLKSKDDPEGETTYSLVYMERPGAVKVGKLEMGNDYWGTGAYMLVVRFGQDSTTAVSYWKNFSIDKASARATPACRSVLAQLRDNLHEGKKVRFCCGKVEGLPTCCCGGWTH